MYDDKTSKANRRPSRAKTLRQTAKLMRRLMLAARTRLDEELRPQEVTAAQLRMLLEVRNTPGASGAQIARACAVTPQTMQAMLAKAVERDWLTRGKDAGNDRLVTFHLTDAGNEMLAHGESIYTKIETRIWRGIETAEIEALKSIVERAVANIEPH